MSARAVQGVQVMQAVQGVQGVRVRVRVRMRMRVWMPLWCGRGVSGNYFRLLGERVNEVVDARGAAPVDEVVHVLLLRGVLLLLVLLCGRESEWGLMLGARVRVGSGGCKCG